MQSSIKVLPGGEFQHGASPTGFSNPTATAATTLSGGFTFEKPMTLGTGTANPGDSTFGSKLASTAAATAAASSGNTTRAQAGFHLGSVASGRTQFSRSSTWKRTRRISKLRARRRSSNKKNIRVSGLGTNSFSGASRFGGFNNSSGASMFGNSVNNSNGAQYGTAATTTTMASTSDPDSFLSIFGQPLMGLQSNMLQNLSSAFGLIGFATPAFGSRKQKFSAQDEGQGQSAPTFGSFSKASASGFMLGSQQTAVASLSIGSGGGTFSTSNSSTVAPAFGSSSSMEGE